MTSVWIYAYRPRGVVWFATLAGGANLGHYHQLSTALENAVVLLEQRIAARGPSFSRSNNILAVTLLNGPQVYLHEVCSDPRQSVGVAALFHMDPDTRRFTRVAPLFQWVTP